MHALLRDTAWHRVTLVKAFARIIAPADSGAPANSVRRLRIVLRQGIGVFRILDEGYDANTEIAAGRTFEWAEAEGPCTEGIPFELRPNQVLWGMVAATNARAQGIMHCSVICEYHGGFPAPGATP